MRKKKTLRDIQEHYPCLDKEIAARPKSQAAIILEENYSILLFNRNVFCLKTFLALRYEE